MPYLNLFKNRYVLFSVIFFISFFVHIIGINQIGRTWDEQFKVDGGYMAWSNLGSKDLSVKSWDYVIEHPMVAKYIYGFFMGPHTIRIDDGAGHYANISTIDIDALEKGNYIKSQIGNRLYMISYDLTTPRLASSVFNSLAVMLTVLIALFILNEYWAALAGLFLLVAPRFVVMGQLITFESLTVFLFSLTVVVYYKLLEKPKNIRFHILVGFLCGLLFWTRYNNFFIFIFLAGWTAIHYKFKKNKDIFNYRLILIPIIAFIFGIIIWPLMWHEFPKYLIESFTFHKYQIVPSFFYFHRLLVTTPIPVLVGLIIGIIFSIKERKYWNIFFLYWFFSVLIIHMIIGVSGGGTRYIFIIYPVVGILCAYGYSKILKKKWIYALIPIFAYMIIEMFTYYPYYLDYFNLFTNGVSGAIRKNYEFSWWGEGQKEVGYYINKNVPEGSSVATFVIPKYVFPALRVDIKNLGYLDSDKTNADYVAVSRGRTGLLSSEFLNTHEVIYSANVKNEPLVILYKKNK